MALAAALKLNTTMRCLDLSIPSNDPEFARLSQDILQSCVRNTENAQSRVTAQGGKTHIAQPIYKSELARELKDLEHGLGFGNFSRDDFNVFLAALPASYQSILKTSKLCIQDLTEILALSEGKSHTSPNNRDFALRLIDQAYSTLR